MIATLFALRTNDAFPDALSRADLFHLAAEIGSDVACCLHGGVARCTGRGEQLVSVAIPENKPLYAVLVKGSESVSTPDAFRRAELALSAGQPAEFTRGLEARGSAVSECGSRGTESPC